MNKKKNNNQTVTAIIAIIGLVGIIAAALYITNSEDTKAAEAGNGLVGATVDTTAGASAYSSYNTSTTAEPAKTETEAPATTNTTPPPPVETAPAATTNDKPAATTYSTPEPAAKPKEDPKPVAKEVVKPVAAPYVAPKPAARPTTNNNVARMAAPAPKRSRGAVEASKNFSSGEDKLLDDSELQNIAKQIVEKGDENAMYLKCVQLHKGQYANNKRSFEQVETYLRSHGFTIAGREVTSRNVKGIEVGPGNGCMRVTIGSF